MRYPLIEELRSGQFLFPAYLAQVKARFAKDEPSILAFLPEDDRFTRLQEDAEKLLLSYPDVVKRPFLFGTLLGVKDIFHAGGFTTQAGSRLPADVLQGQEAESVKRLKEAVIPLSPSLDHVGFFASDLDTAIAAARVLFDHWDEPTLPLRKPRLGIPEGPYLQNASVDNLSHFQDVHKLLENAGYEVHAVQLMSDFAEVRARHDVIMSAEAAYGHADWFANYASLYSPKFTELIQRGKKITNPQLQSALSVREDFRAEIRRAFLDHNIDLWICPSAIDAAPKGLDSTGDPVMNLPWTQAGLPTLNLPVGKNQVGLPLGLQIVANWYKDESLLFWSRDLEKVLSTL